MRLIPKAAAGSASRHKANADCTTTAITGADLQQHLPSIMCQCAQPLTKYAAFCRMFGVFS